MKKILLALTLLFSFLVGNSQVKITDMSTYSGDPAGGWVPIVVSGANRKIDAGNLGRDSLAVSQGPVYDTLKWYRNGSNTFYKLVRAGQDTTSLSNRINLKVDSIRKSNDSLYQYVNGTRTFIGTIASGSGSGTVNSGTQYRLAYYGATGTAVSEAGAITGSRLLVSDANGVPTHSSVTATEAGYLSGTTSSVQTQLNSKQATITGAATTVASSNLTASRSLVSDGSGKIAVSSVTATELGYLSGVTSAIQTQLNAKAGGSLTSGYFPRATGANTLSNDLLYGNGASIGINNALPDASAVLDVASSSKGALLPRVSNSEMLAISSPATGLTVFNTTNSAYYTYYSSSWHRVADADYITSTLGAVGWDVTYDSLVREQGNDIDIKSIRVVAGSNVTVTKTVTDSTISYSVAASSGGSISDGDKGDITVSSSGATWTVDNSAITSAKINDGTIATADIGDAQVTNAKLANSTISGVALGSNLATLTIASPLTGTSYNGSTGVTIDISDASSSADGAMTANQYKRLFTAQTSSNPTGTITHNENNGGQHAITFSSTGGRTLAFSNLNTGDIALFTFNNTSGASITLTLPSNSYVNFSSAASATIPTNLSSLSLYYYDGTNYYFNQSTDASGVTDGDKGDITIGSSGTTYTIDNDAVTTSKIANSNVTLAKIENIANLRFLGNVSGSSAPPSALTAGQVMTELPVVTGDAGSGGVKGVVPAPAAGDAAANKYLHADGTWKTVSGSGGGYTTIMDEGASLTQETNLNFDSPLKATAGDGRTDVTFDDETRYQAWYTRQSNLTLNSYDGFYGGASGAGSGVAIMTTGNTLPGYFGGISLATGTTTTGYAYMAAASTATAGSVVISLDNAIRTNVGLAVRFEDLFDGTEDWQWHGGLCELVTTTGSITDGVYFYVNRTDSSGQFVAVCESNGTKTEDATGVTVAADTEYKLEITVYNGTAKFYITTGFGGTKTLVSTITTNIPTGAARNTNLVSLFYKIAGTTSRTAYMRWMAYGTRDY